MKRLALLLTLMGCHDPIRLQDGFVQLSPPDSLVDRSALYREWWTAVEECSGIVASFDRVRWFWHPSEDYPIALDGQPIGALTKWRTHRIFLGRHAAADSRIVSHEILHDLLQANGHPPEYFERRCAKLVSHGYLSH